MLRQKCRNEKEPYVRIYGYVSLVFWSSIKVVISIRLSQNMENMRKYNLIFNWNMSPGDPIGVQWNPLKRVCPFCIYQTFYQSLKIYKYSRNNTHLFEILAIFSNSNQKNSPKNNLIFGKNIDSRDLSVVFFGTKSNYFSSLQLLFLGKWILKSIFLPFLI